jgi:hypothetical protein
LVRGADLRAYVKKNRDKMVPVSLALLEASEEL